MKLENKKNKQQNNSDEYGYGTDYFCKDCQEDCVWCEEYSSSPNPHPIRDR